MPIYEYQCRECNERFSLLRSVQVNHADTKCTECGSTNVKKMMSPFCCSSSQGSGAPFASTGGYGGT